MYPSYLFVKVANKVGNCLCTFSFTQFQNGTQFHCLLFTIFLEITIYTYILLYSQIYFLLPSLVALFSNFFFSTAIAMTYPFYFYDCFCNEI